MPIREEIPLEAPIAGMSMTHELGARPWQTPPKQTTVQEVIAHYIERMQDESLTEQIVNILQSDVTVTALANTIQLAGVMDGRHSIDVGILIMPVLIEMMQLVADAEGVEYVTGMERNMEGETKDSDVSAALATFKDNLDNKDSDEKKAQDMDIVEERDEPSMGLMARRD